MGFQVEIFRSSLISVLLMGASSAQAADFSDFRRKATFIAPECLNATRIADLDQLWLQDSWGLTYFGHRHIGESGVSFDSPVSYDPSQFTGLQIPANMRGTSQKGDQRDVGAPTATTVWQLFCGHAGTGLNSFWMDRPSVMDTSAGGPFNTYGVSWAIPSSIDLEGNLEQLVDTLQPYRRKSGATELRPFSETTSDLVFEASIKLPWTYRVDKPLAVWGDGSNEIIGQLGFNLWMLDTTTGKQFTINLSIFDTHSTQAGAEFVGSAAGDRFASTGLARYPGEVRNFVSTPPISSVFQGGVNWSDEKFFRAHFTRQNFINALTALDEGYSLNPSDYILTDATVFHELGYAKEPGATNARSEVDRRDNISMSLSVRDFAVYEATTFLRNRASDLTGDRKADIAFTDRTPNNGAISRLVMNGFSVVSNSVVHYQPDTAWSVVGSGDFNGDGVADHLWRHSNGAIAIQLYTSAGTPSTGLVTFYSEPSAAWQVVGTPDLDGDGKADIVWRNTSDGRVWGMVMNGASIRDQGLVYTEADQSWSIVGWGDLLGRGHDNQALWRNSSSGQLYAMLISYFNGGFVQHGAMVYTEPNTSWRVIGVADFNGDKKSDILYRNDSTGEIYGLLMNGFSTSNGATFHTESDAAWIIADLADFNGDGKADLLWRNTSSGEIWMMQMNGLSILAQQHVHVLPHSLWKVIGTAEFLTNN